MENLSKTVEGRITTLMDNLGQELARTAEKTGLTKKFGRLLESATESLQGLSGVAESDVSAALGMAEEAMDSFGSVTTQNLDEVEQKMAAAKAAMQELVQASGGGPSTGDLTLTAGLTAFGLGAFAPGVEEAKERAAAMQPLLDMMAEIDAAGVQLNETVMSGNLAQGEATAAVEAHSAVELGKVQEMHGTMASDIMAAAMSNHTLQGSYEAVGAVAITTRDAMVELGNFAAAQLPNMMQQAFTSIVDGAGSFRDFMLDMLERLLIKLAAMLAAFAALSIMFPTSKAVTGGLGKFMAGGFGVQGFAAGGLVTGPTLGMIGEGPGTTLSNPEVIAPLDKLQQMMGGGNVTVTGMIRGSDI